MDAHGKAEIGENKVLSMTRRGMPVKAAHREIVEACDVEGFGLVFLEANACGKPVIGGRSGGIPEAVVDGVTGLLVDPHDSEDIANAIARLLMDSELSNRLGRQGRLRVARDFTWSQVGDRVQGILESILREKSTRSQT